MILDEPSFATLIQGYLHYPLPLVAAQLFVEPDNDRLFGPSEKSGLARIPSFQEIAYRDQRHSEAFRYLHFSSTATP